MKSTITEAQQQAIRDYVMSHNLSYGKGTEESACSIAAINLALSGKLTDNIPDCMSEVIGRWIIVVQDAMPYEMRNSLAWKSLLPLAAGTGRDREQERRNILLDWMWGTVLPIVQPVADKHGFGAEWTTMLEERTKEAFFPPPASCLLPPSGVNAPHRLGRLVERHPDQRAASPLRSFQF